MTPLYHQVYLVLSQRIRDGSLDPAAPLPGEHQLASQFGVSRVTIRRTLEQLELEGLVQKRRGIGSFPVPRPREFRDRYNIGGLTDAHPPRTTETTTLSVATGVPPAAVLDRLGPASREAREFTRVIRVRSAGGDPFTLMTAWLPPPVAGRVSPSLLRSAPIPAAVEGAGIALARAEQAVTATAADESSAKVLGVPMGAPLLAMTTVFSDADGQAVLVLEALYRPDRYEYRTTMLRRGDGKGRRWHPAG